MDFESISTVLLNHLPRVVAGGPVTFNEGELRVDHRGVSVGDLADFIAELSGDKAFVPEGLPIRDIKLRDLLLSKSSLADSGFELHFTVAWKRTDLSVAPGFPLRMAEVLFEWSNQRLIAEATIKLQFEGFELNGTISLPAQVIEASLEPVNFDKSAAYLADRGLVSDSISHTLKVFSVEASIPFQRVILHLELQDVFDFGPVKMVHAMAELWLGESAAQSAFSAEGILKVEINGSRSVQIDVAGEIDDHGWSLAGHLSIDQGSFTIGTMVKHFSSGNVSLPSVISSLKLSEIAARVDTHDRLYSLDCTVAWDGQNAQLMVHLESRAGALSVSGTLKLGDVVFRVAFESGDAKVLVGSFDAAGAAGLTLDEILSAVGIDADGALGQGASGISISTRAIGAALDKNAKLLIAAQLDAGVDLSRMGDLPLIGSLLPDSDHIGLSIRPYFQSPGFVAEDEARRLFPVALALPDGPLKDNLNLAAELHLGSIVEPLPSVDLGSSPQAATQAKQSSPSAQSAPAGLEWKEVGKALGPVRIDRIGWALGENNTSIDIAFDAALSIAGLSLSIEGLGAKYTFASQSLEPHLQGLGLDVRKGPLALSGGFLNVDGDFAGKILIGTPSFSISALGAFKMIDGAPSVFIFGVLGMPLGGPPFFFVEGLAAGFGIHRKIHLPTIDRLREFPLVAAANATSVGAPPDPDPGAQLRLLHEYIEPKLGEYFFAAGIKFNSFQLLHGNVVAIVAFGSGFEVDLLGTADFTTPPDLPENTPALARVQLDLIARFSPDEGLIAVEARLNPKSYVYGPLCHLSGGFAFYSWMSGEHSGDFVLSVGGYSSHYIPQPHYPAVPRVELKYQVTEDIYLKGDAYFALTPSVMMAGGGLHVNAQLGSVHAWGDFTLDMMIRWQPFHYDAWAHLGMGAKWKCFHTSASVDLYIGGPKFHGHATIDWSVISFDVEFGPTSFALPAPISLESFQRIALGYDGTAESLDNTLGVLITAGQISQLGDMPVVAPAELEIETSSRIPITEISLAGAESGSFGEQQAIGMAPFAPGHSLSSTHDVSVMRNGQPVSADFVIHDTTTVRFPPALWGQSFAAKPEALPLKAVSGVTLRVQAPLHEVSSVSVRVEDIRYDPHPPRLIMPIAGFSIKLPPAADTLYDVILRKTGPNKVNVIKLIRNVAELNLIDAKNIAEAGGAILTGLTLQAAQKIHQDFVALSADIDIIVSAAGEDEVEVDPSILPEAPDLVPPDFGHGHLILLDYGNSKISVIKVVRELTGLGLKDSKDLTEASGPVLINQPLTAIEAGYAKLVEAGATVELVGEGQTSGEDPQPELPLTDLEMLGVPLDDLVVAPFRNSRLTVTLRAGESIGLS